MNCNEFLEALTSSDEGRQTAARSQTSGLDKQSIRDKVLDDVRHGLRAEMRMPRDLHASDRSELAHDVQHHPSVVGPIPLRVAPDRRPRSCLGFSWHSTHSTAQR